MNTPTFRESVTNAIRYWERARIVYNVALIIVVAAVFWFYWPNSLQALDVDLVLGCFVFFVLANIAFCAAYPVDLLAQSSEFRPIWIRVRPAVFILGTLFASVITLFLARSFLDTAI